MKLFRYSIGFALGSAVTGMFPVLIKRLCAGPHGLGNPVPGNAVTLPRAPFLPVGPRHVPAAPVSSTPQNSLHDANAAIANAGQAARAADAATRYAVDRNAPGRVANAITNLSNAWTYYGMALVHLQHAPAGHPGLPDVKALGAKVKAAEARVIAALRG